MRIKIRLLILNLIFLSFYKGHAYELKDVIKDTMQHNQELSILKEELAITTLTKAKAVTEFLPDIKAEWKKVNNNEGRSKLMITQEVYAGGKSIARIASANAKIASGNQEYKEKVNNIIYDVISTYQSVLTTRDKIKVMKNDIVIAKKNLDSVNINVDTGADTKSKSFLAKAYLAELESDLKDAQNQLVAQEANFKYHTGKNPPNDCKSINFKKYEDIINKSQDIQTLVTLNNKIIRAENEVEESKQSVNIAASEILPKVALSAEVEKTSEFKGAKHSVEISSTLFNAGNYVNISKARKYKDLKKIELNDITKSVRNDLNKAWIEYKSANNILNLSKIAEEYQYKTLLAAEAEVKYGSKSITDIIQIQRSYNKFVINRLEKEKKKLLSIFKIYKITGDLITMYNI